MRILNRDFHAGKSASDSSIRLQYTLMWGIYLGSEIID